MHKPKITIIDETLKYGEKKYNVKIEVEIFSTDNTVGSKKIARQTITEELEDLIYEVFEDHYRFKGNDPEQRTNADVNISREAIMFEGKIKNNIIYRR